MDIREAKFTDCRAITHLLDRAFADEREYNDATPLKEIEESMRHADAWVVGTREDQIIACVCVYSQRLEGNVGRIGQLAVEPSFWGRGHAVITTTSRYLATTERTLKDALQQFEQRRAEIAKRCTDVAHVAQTPSADPPAEGLQNRTNSLDLVN